MTNNAGAKRGSIAILHQVGGGNLGDDAKLAAFSALLVNSYALSLFGTDTGCDPGVISDLRLALLTNHNVATAEYDPVNSIDDLLSKMSSVDYVLTCRFHGVVFAHKPILALSPHPKVRTLMSDLGLSKYCMEIQTFEAVGLFDTLFILMNDLKQKTIRSGSVRICSQATVLLLRVASLALLARMLDPAVFYWWAWV